MAAWWPMHAGTAAAAHDLRLCVRVSLSEFVAHFIRMSGVLDLVE